MFGTRLKRPLWSLLSHAERLRNAAGFARGKSLPGAPGAALRCDVFYNRFGGYCVPRSSRHRPAAQKIMSGQVWEEPTLAYIASLGGSGDIVHAGTYFGDFLPLLSRAASGHVVWAFEPNPENYRCALVTILLNDLPNVRLTQAALGSARHAAALVTRAADGRSLGGASHLAATPETPADVPVEVVAVDDLVPGDRPVRVLQLDVEGQEQEALTGAMQTIRRCRPVIVLETPPWKWLTEQLWPLGYSAGERVADNQILLPAR